MLVLALAEDARNLGSGPEIELEGTEGMVIILTAELVRPRRSMTPRNSPPRIVVIEDDPSDTVLSHHALDEQDKPYVLEVLRDGESALQFVRDHCQECRPEPCLIVLDLHLPRYDGATVLRAIRCALELAHVKVVVLTSMASPAEKAKVIALGVELHRTQPMNWDETVELASELITICYRSSEHTAAQPA